MKLCEITMVVGLLALPVSQLHAQNCETGKQILFNQSIPMARSSMTLSHAINSIGDLKWTAPQLYPFMVQSIHLAFQNPNYLGRLLNDGRWLAKCRDVTGED
jgi:hypothetical protein